MRRYLSEYSEQISKMRWSYSRLTSYEHCPYSFYLQYIVKDDDLYLSESNFYAEAGVFVHELLEKFFKREITQEQAAVYFKDNFKKSICYKAKPETMKKTFDACLDYFENGDFSWLKNYEVLGVEKEVKFRIPKNFGENARYINGNGIIISQKEYDKLSEEEREAFELDGYDFIGYIDLLLRDKRDGKIVVCDNKSSEFPFTKSGAVKKNCKGNFDKYHKQMTLYSYSVFLEYGEYPKELMWNHFKEYHGKLAVVPFEIGKYNEAVRWMIETIHEIEQEEDYNPNYEYFYCSQLCNFRNSCETAVKEKRKSWRKR